VDTVSVDPEEVKFTRIEPPPEDEKEESREKALGLVDAPEGESRRAPEGDFVEDIDEGLEDWTEPAKVVEPAAEDKEVK
jgi:hypothetical protein